MEIFGIALWRITLIIVLIFIVVKRANLVAIVAKWKYNHRDYQGAAKVFKIANTIGNLSIANQILMGYNYLRCGNVEQARVTLNRVMLLTKRGSADRFQAKSILALAEWKGGNLEDAIELLEEVMEDGYKNTVIYQNLGVLYNIQGDAEKAIRFSEEAKEYNSDDNIIMDNLADAYALAGDYQKAAEIYEELVNREEPPRFPEAYYGYGKVLVQLGEKERGLEMIKKSLEKPFTFLSVRPKEEIEELYASLSRDEGQTTAAAE